MPELGRERGSQSERESVREGHADLLGSDQGLSQNQFDWLNLKFYHNFTVLSFYKLSLGHKKFCFHKIVSKS